MNIKRIIKEEIDDFEWVKNTSYEDILDNHFGIESNDYLAWFRGIEDKNNVHPSYEKYNELVEANWSKLYRIIYGEKMYKWKGLIKRLRIGNKLDNWRIDRLDKLEEYYPRMYKKQQEHPLPVSPF